MEDLSRIREEIDRIDQQLADLLRRRMDCSRKVAEYKAVHSLPVLDRRREQQVLDKVRRQVAAGNPGAEAEAEAAALIYSTIMDASRALQHRQLEAGESLRASIAAAMAGPGRRFPPGESLRVACPGRPGSFSHEAASCLFPGTAPAFVEAFPDVFDAVEEGRADYGVVPVENSTTGSVHEVYDLMMARRFTIAAAAEVPVRHCLLALPGADPSALKTVYSHQQALSQCSRAIAARGLAPHPYVNTATAAEMLVGSGEPTACVIASREAGEIYGLDIIEENIQNDKNNCTRFLAISSRLVIPEDADKISLIFSLPHTTGSLYHALARFAMAGLNLTKIESRPLRGGGFAYAFYLDFEGNLSHPGTVDLLCALSEEMPRFTFLGNYRERSATAEETK